MSTPAFQFKKFVILQEQCAFKVGTDAVLLGAWADPTDAKSILDVGTGSGVLALMMAQKSQAKITAIDLDVGAYQQALENAKASSWKSRIDVKHLSVQDFANDEGSSFDLIITNPPYFVNPAHATGSSLSKARNTETLSFSDLAKAAYKLLADNGAFYVVLPTPEAKRFREIAEKNGFVLAKLLRVQTKPGEAYEKRHLMRFQKTAYQFQENILVIEESSRGPNGEQIYTEAYRTLTKDFYLAF